MYSKALCEWWDGEEQLARHHRRLRGIGGGADMQCFDGMSPFTVATCDTLTFVADYSTREVRGGNIPSKTGDTTR